MKSKILLSTPFGPVALIWSIIEDIPIIIRVILSRPELSAKDLMVGLYPDLQESSCAKIDNVANSVQSFLEGEDVVFSLESVAINQCSPFQRSVLIAEHGIPRGCVSTYKLIGDYLGKERGARAVGNALANNPFPIIIPCHRAIRSDRSIGGFQGGLDMKRTLLMREGIKFDGAGRVSVNSFQYERNQNDELQQTFSEL
jgi:methylated-DNA-[protein]-cysteine S-methyltransferase